MSDLIVGDCIEVLKGLPDRSVQCCVTSPPYYGLRDYGVEGQIGLEPTPDEYVAKLVSVFREVKRVLKDDGVLWLNLGDSYAGSNNGSNDHREEGASLSKNDDKYGAHKPGLAGLKPKDLIGIPWSVAFALRQPYEKHLINNLIDRAYIAGLVDGEGCITIQKTKSSHCDSFSFPPIVQIRMCDVESIDHFSSLIGVHRSEPELYNSGKNSNQRPSYNVKATAQKAMDLIADIYPYLRVKNKQAIVAYNHQLLRNKTNHQPRSDRQIELEQYCKNLINDLNQRRLVDIPNWMVEPKIESESGWYLRQDLIWAKPNPMPESVKDRCTKSHEYIFLLSKSQKYYYDYEAILEPSVWFDEDPRSAIPGGVKSNGKCATGQYATDKVAYRQDGMRNKRDVWTVTTKPYKEAHFATFPPDLIEPCILAGSRPGDTVLDPFNGSGTTGAVAIKHHRNYIGIELNPKYIKLTERRLRQVQLVLTEVVE